MPITILPNAKTNNIIPKRRHHYLIDGKTSNKVVGLLDGTTFLQGVAEANMYYLYRSYILLVPNINSFCQDCAKGIAMKLEFYCCRVLAVIMKITRQQCRTDDILLFSCTWFIYCCIREGLLLFLHRGKYQRL